MNHNMMLHNPYELIIIQENVIPSEDLEELMLLTNNKDTSHATIIDKNKEGDSSTDLDVRHTLWYKIPDEIHAKLQGAVSGSFLS
mgnify:CR=1 FL=1